MIALVQRVSSASVSVVGRPEKNTIRGGLVVLLGVDRVDGQADVEKLAGKITKLRIFADPAGKMNLDITAGRGELLLVSQFTLLADTTGGNRPSFIKAAEPDLARGLYENLAARLASFGIPVKTGFFGESMEIETVLDGPVTLYLDSKTL